MRILYVALTCEDSALDWRAHAPIHRRVKEGHHPIGTTVASSGQLTSLTSVAVQQPLTCLPNNAFPTSFIPDLSPAVTTA